MEKEFKTFDKLPRIKGDTSLEVELTNDNCNSSKTGEIVIGKIENVTGEIFVTAYNDNGELITEPFRYFREV